MAVLVTIVVVSFLRWSADATVPIAFSLFLIVLFWPVQRRLELRLPKALAFLLTFLLMLFVLALALGAIAYSVDAIAQRAPEYADRARELVDSLRAALSDVGMEASFGDGSIAGVSAGDIARRVVPSTFGAASLILTIIAFTALGLVEVRSFGRKVRSAFSDKRSDTIIEAAHDITYQFNRYLVARTISGLINGTAIALFAWIVGLDFAIIWGILNVLMSYVPVVGAVLATVPIVLFAAIQFDGLTAPLLIGLGTSAIQLTLGNYLDPIIQGRYLSMSPFVVFASIVFWGWVWGVPGALLGVPIMVGVMIAADHFEKTRWIARILARTREEQGSA